MTRETLLSIISEGRETSHVDFKREFYKSIKGSELPKDIAAFANVLSDDPKVIILGVDDESRTITGISKESFITQDALDEYISKTIEPFVTTEVGFVEDGDKFIGYIEILASNVDRPYMIKIDCGKNNAIKKGDVFVRKGSCIQKATRDDLDAFKKKGTLTIRIHDSISVIEPIRFAGELIETPTYGRIDIELFNGTTEPVLIDGGAIFISTSKHSVCQRIVSILPSRNIQDRPFELPSMARKVHTILYCFLSGDCVKFGFDGGGFLEEEAKIRIELADTDGIIYKSEEAPILMRAKGDILHKVCLNEKRNSKKEPLITRVKKVFTKR